MNVKCMKWKGLRLNHGRTVPNLNSGIDVLFSHGAACEPCLPCFFFDNTYLERRSIWKQNCWDLDMLLKQRSEEEQTRNLRDIKTRAISH